jgi:acyl-CoA thioesterase YciA
MSSTVDKTEEVAVPKLIDRTGYLASRTIAMPANRNMNGDIFGGWIMSEMDLAAAIAGSRHSNSRVVTVAVDQIIFKAPVKVGDTISCYTWITKVGRTSMQVRILVVCKDLGGRTTHEVTEGFFTMVAIDEDGKPNVIPKRDLP